ncbi:flagellar biosynthetic protein FliR [Novispirillum sp. DQ9]|uniref:flagellar biosynthetic protein FliR n=1 Tax=Novispirillum sp. DQ9 TaxID=3398612 RepID=UPI003C7C94EB
MLQQFLTLNTFHILLVFVRLGMVFMLIPGFSASYVSPRVRLLIALTVTLVAVPLVSPVLPPLPESAAGLVRLVVLEAFIGLFLGLLAQAAVAALHLAGTAIGQNTGLMNAMVFDPVTEQQGALVIGLLANVAIVLLFVLDMHHLIIQAIVSSYSLFIPGTAPLPSDHLAVFVDQLSQAFFMGLQLAAPFIVYGILFQVTMGIMARLSPQMNVFFVSLPLQIILGLGVLMVAMPAFLMTYLAFFEDTFTRFLP